MDKHQIEESSLEAVTGGAEEELIPIAEAEGETCFCRTCGVETLHTVSVEHENTGAPEFIHFEKTTLVCSVCGRTAVIKQVE